MDSHLRASGPCDCVTEFKSNPTFHVSHHRVIIIIIISFIYTR